MKSFFAVIGIFIFVVCMYWLVKNGSYFLWYEDMVKETIRETVKEEALRQL